MGMWRELMDDGLSREGFYETMKDVISFADYDWVLHAWGNEGNRPVGLALARSFGAGRAIEPHIDWFPWATSRNKVEIVAAFIKQIGRSFKIFIFSPEETAHFWAWFAKRRMLMKGGQVIDFFSVGEHARLFYTRGP